MNFLISYVVVKKLWDRWEAIGTLILENLWFLTKSSNSFSSWETFHVQRISVTSPLNFTWTNPEGVAPYNGVDFTPEAFTPEEVEERTDLISAPLLLQRKKTNKGT